MTIELTEALRDGRDKAGTSTLTTVQAPGPLFRDDSSPQHARGALPPLLATLTILLQPGVHIANPFALISPVGTRAKIVAANHVPRSGLQNPISGPGQASLPHFTHDSLAEEPGRLPDGRAVLTVTGNRLSRRLWSPSCRSLRPHGKANGDQAL